MKWPTGPVSGVCPHCQQAGTMQRTDSDRFRVYYRCNNPECKTKGAEFAYVLGVTGRGGNFRKAEG